MISFLRNIRNRLLSENKLSSYLLYAVGEILLVVIGILIALQVNNVNEARKGRIKEKTLIAEIHEEFSASLGQFERFKRYHNEAYIWLQEVNELIQSESNYLHIDSMFLEIQGNPRAYTFNPSSGTVRSLISSGNFDLIRNDTLRRLLIGWEDVLKDYLEEEAELDKFERDILDPYLMKHFDPSISNISINHRAYGQLEFKNIMKRLEILRSEIITAWGQEPIEKNLRKIVAMTAPDYPGNQ